jgi:hypothetical protein
VRDPPCRIDLTEVSLITIRLVPVRRDSRGWIMLRKSEAASIVREGHRNRVGGTHDRVRPRRLGIGIR